MPVKRATKRARGWCATFFTEPSDMQPNKLRYGIYGEEVCPRTKKKHWQSYLEFNAPQTMAAIKKMFSDPSIHLEQRKGTRDQARDYCMKDGSFIETGTWISGQGARTDLTPIIDALKEGESIEDVMLDNPEVYCRYRNGLNDIAAVVQQKNIEAWRVIKITLHCGPTNTGKTRDAMKEATFKVQGCGLKWFNGYKGDKAILIDEYNNDVKIGYLLTLLDGYMCRLEIKGSHTYANWDRVFITTNLRPQQLHANARPAHRAALFRRILQNGGSIINDWCLPESVLNNKRELNSDLIVHESGFIFIEDQEPMIPLEPPPPVNRQLLPYFDALVESQVNEDPAPVNEDLVNTELPPLVRSNAVFIEQSEDPEPILDISTQELNSMTFD